MKLPSLTLAAVALLMAADSTGPSLIPESKVEPKYTDEAREAKISGTVVLEIQIDTEGVPAVLSVKKPLGYGLDETAMEALGHWRFRPATKNGTPVATTATVEFQFRLTDSPPPARNQ